MSDLGYCECGEWRALDEPCPNCGDFEAAQDWRVDFGLGDPWEEDGAPETRAPFPERA